MVGHASCMSCPAVRLPLSTMRRGGRPRGLVTAGLCAVPPLGLLRLLSPSLSTKFAPAIIWLCRQPLGVRRQAGSESTIRMSWMATKPARVDPVLTEAQFLVALDCMEAIASDFSVRLRRGLPLACVRSARLSLILDSELSRPEWPTRTPRCATSPGRRSKA